MSNKPTQRQEDNLDGMMEDIKNGLFEDFQFTSKEQAQAILDKLKAKVNAINVDEILNEDD